MSCYLTKIRFWNFYTYASLLVDPCRGENASVFVYVHVCECVCGCVCVGGCVCVCVCVCLHVCMFTRVLPFSVVN